VSNYILALKYGVKYIYQTMPRMLTLWLDLGEKEAAKKCAQRTHRTVIPLTMQDLSVNVPRQNYQADQRRAQRSARIPVPHGLPANRLADRTPEQGDTPPAA
jgi:hypothetical protein